jgi:hypothetical protein
LVETFYFAILAYADTGSSPYAGQQTRAIKALSSEDIEELRAGAGMGRFTAHDPKPTST